MRATPTKKQKTHQRILDAAGQSFRRNGYAGIGVDGIAKAAGATSGAFYAHFGSKDGAFRAALAAGLDEVIEAVPVFQKEHGADWVEAFSDYYLGKPHRDDLACGCAMATLTPEVVRSTSDIHTIYEQKMTVIAELVADGLANGSTEQRRGRAWAMLGVLIGGINVARAMESENAAKEVAKSIKITAIKAAGRTRSALPDKL